MQLQLATDWQHKVVQVLITGCVALIQFSFHLPELPGTTKKKKNLRPHKNTYL